MELIPEKLPPFAHGARDFRRNAESCGYFPGAPAGHWHPFGVPTPLSVIPCGFAVLMTARKDS